MKAVLCSILLLGCFCLLATTSAAAEDPARSHVECSSLASRILSRSVPYCVMLPPSYTRTGTARYPVSYFLHGIGDSEQAVANIAEWGIYDQLLANKRVGELVIIAPSGFTSFYINSHDGRFRYEDFFLNEFLPAMEKRYRIGSTGAQRGIMGVSMGGYGALHYAFKYPEQFAAVSATMPALVERLPRRLDMPILQTALDAVFGSPPDPAFYDKNSVMHLARIAPQPALRRLTIYFDCGAQDRFGFERGVAELDTLLSDRGVPHEAHIYPGGHNWQFVTEHFDGALQAQWRGFHAR
jgi:S-formylglutathione hydrolase FrmB